VVLDDVLPGIDLCVVTLKRTCIKIIVIVWLFFIILRVVIFIFLKGEESNLRDVNNGWGRGNEERVDTCGAEVLRGVGHFSNNVHEGQW